MGKAAPERLLFIGGWRTQGKRYTLWANELPLTEERLELVKRQITEETIPMKLTWHGHSAFRIEAGEAKILIDSFLSENPSRDNGWSGYLTGEKSTQGGDR
jgi:hypothetical protein